MSEHEHVSDVDAGFVLSTLEHDQLVAAKREPVPRRQLRGGNWRWCGRCGCIWCS